MFQHCDERTDDAGGHPEDREPEQGETDAVFRGDAVRGEKGDKRGIPGSDTVDGDGDRSNRRGDRKHEEQREVGHSDSKELRDKIQLREKNDVTEKRDEEGETKVFEPREVFVEGFDGVVHIPLRCLEYLCLKEFFEQSLRFVLSDEKDENRGDRYQSHKADEEQIGMLSE